MKRTIISGLSLLALSAIAVEAIATPTAINRIAAATQTELASRHRDSELPNPTTFGGPQAIASRHRDSELPNPTTFGGPQAIASRHRDSELPNP
ncbi:MAG: hypothetical protein WBA43_10125, partial [Elainellaceae cyanobacterium]